MSGSFLNTPAPESNTLPGLSTPQLNGSAPSSSRQPLSSISTSGKKTTAFDIAHEIERELAKATQLLDKNDKEINTKIDDTLRRVAALQGKGK